MYKRHSSLRRYYTVWDWCIWGKTIPSPKYKNVLQTVHFIDKERLREAYPSSEYWFIDLTDDELQMVFEYQETLFDWLGEDGQHYLLQEQDFASMYE